MRSLLSSLWSVSQPLMVTLNRLIATFHPTMQALCFQRELTPFQVTQLEISIFIVYSLVIIDIIGLLICLAYQYYRRSAHDFHHCALGYVMALALAWIITNVMKTYAGRYRPDWYVTSTSYPYYFYPKDHISRLLYQTLMSMKGFNV